MTTTQHQHTGDTKMKTLDERQREQLKKWYRQDTLGAIRDAVEATVTTALVITAVAVIVAILALL